jgi:squalene-hopene/tetraprenyl-beta-curcumene cyclase
MSGSPALAPEEPQNTANRAKASGNVIPLSPSPQQLLRDRIEACVSLTQEMYLREQYPEGYWWYRLESNDTISAEYIMLLKFLELDQPSRITKLANHILANQREDGTWAIHHGAAGDISTTVEAYFALKLAGISPESPELTKAREFILAMGGVEETRIFTKIFLALFGCYPWKNVPSLPVEIMLLPPRFLFSVYDFSSWARATLIPISILLHKKPCKSLPEKFRLSDITVPNGKSKSSGDRLQRLFWVLDDLVKLWEKIPSNGFRTRALRAAEDWILSHQETSGDWGGIQPAMVNSLLALHTLGYPMSHPVMQKGLEALEQFCLETEHSIELQACVSPVWDTALTSLALLQSGLPPDDASIESAARWLLDRQVFDGGDWQVKVKGGNPGGWAFEFKNDHYPDVDDTAVVLMFLNSIPELGGEEVRAKLEAGVQWVFNMRGKDGGWGAFDKDNNKSYLNKIPFADLEAMIDPSTADLTGRVLEMMGNFGFSVEHPFARDAIRFIREKQERNGSWWGRWGVNYIYGTWSVLSGLSRIGEDVSKPYVRRAVAWLKASQNADGGWGEPCDSYKEPQSVCSGPSTASQTAWAVLSLMAAGEHGSDAVFRGIQFLLDRQTPEGTWEEQEFTGTGFPKFFMIRYHNYRNCFPLLALGNYLRYLKGK